MRLSFGFPVCKHLVHLGCDWNARTCGLSILLTALICKILYSKHVHLMIPDWALFWVQQPQFICFLHLLNSMALVDLFSAYAEFKASFNLFTTSADCCSWWFSHKVCNCSWGLGFILVLKNPIELQNALGHEMKVGP